MRENLNTTSNGNQSSEWNSLFTVDYRGLDQASRDELQDDLSNIDDMFAHGRIDAEKRDRYRKEVLEKHGLGGPQAGETEPSDDTAEPEPAPVADDKETSTPQWDPRLTQEQIDDMIERDIYEPVGQEYEQALRQFGIEPRKESTEKPKAHQWDPRLTQEQIDDMIERDIYEPVGQEYEQALRQFGIEPRKELTKEEAAAVAAAEEELNRSLGRPESTPKPAPAETNSDKNAEEEARKKAEADAREAAEEEARKKAEADAREAAEEEARKKAEAESNGTPDGEPESEPKPESSEESAEEAEAAKQARIKELLAERARLTNIEELKAKRESLISKIRAREEKFLIRRAAWVKLKGFFSRKKIAAAPEAESASEQPTSPINTEGTGTGAEEGAPSPEAEYTYSDKIRKQAEDFGYKIGGQESVDILTDTTPLSDESEARYSTWWEGLSSDKRKAVLDFVDILENDSNKKQFGWGNGFRAWVAKNRLELAA